VVLVWLRARALPLRSLVPACVPLVVPVVCDADVLWLVVALGLIVTVLFGMALKFASMLTVVLALGCTAWPAVVLVSLLAVCASAAPLIAANTAAAITVKFFRIMVKPPVGLTLTRCSFRA
jgi:hypothetical protein